MALSWMRLASIPLYVNIKPKIFPELTPKAHFKGLSFMSCLRSSSKVSVNALCGRGVLWILRAYHRYKPPWIYLLGSKYPGHHPLINCPCVFQTKRHYVVIVQFVGRDEGYFLHVRRVHRNLMVFEEGI